MSETPILGLPLIAAAQARKHVTHNEAIDLIDRLMLLSVRSRTLTAPPADAAPGDRFAVAPQASGAWAGHDGQLAVAETGGWSFIAPKPGWLAFVVDEAMLAVFLDGGWIEPRRLGIGTRPDAINQFAAALTNALFTDLGAGLRIKVNKSTAASTASYLFQSGWSGRAEFGLIGGDDFELKVSADGGSWKRVFHIDRNSGLASFDGGAARASCDVLTASGSWTKPDWARLVTLCAIGGGGGGGAGRTGAAGSLRYGGGGGGGGMVVEQFLASELGGSVVCTVGTGGAGAAANAAGGSNGANGGAGLPSYAISNGVELLRALGGEGGLGGTSSAGVGGNGGIGNDAAGNAGGLGNGAYGLPNITAMLGAAALSGGGGGGYLDASNAVTNGGAGGIGGRSHGETRRAAGGAGGATGVAGSAGGDKTWTRGLGAGGGGGGPNAAGGAGGFPGGGGGGGGGATNGASAGAGGAGGRGEIRIIAIG